MITNDDVKAAFVDGGRPAKTKNLESRDGSLISFGHLELARWVDNRIIIRRGWINNGSSRRHQIPPAAGTYARNSTPSTQDRINL